MKHTIFIVLSLFFLQCLSGQSHPHIIIKNSEYDSLRQRSVQWAWSVMKTKAIQTYHDMLNYFARKGTKVLFEGSDWIKMQVPAGNHHFEIGSPYSVSIENSEIIGSKGDY